MADWMLAVAMEDGRLQDTWLPASDFFAAVAEDEYSDGNEANQEADKFTFQNFVKSVNTHIKKTMKSFDGRHNGVLVYFFSAPRQPSVFYYYMTELGRKVIKPKQGTTFPSIRRPVSVRPKKKRSAPKSSTTTGENLPINPPDGGHISNNESRLATKDTTPDVPVEAPPAKKTRWDWIEFKELFRPNKHETVQECLDRRIAALAHVNRKEKNWKDIIDHPDQAEQCYTNFCVSLASQVCSFGQDIRNGFETYGWRSRFSIVLRKGDSILFFDQ